MIDPAALNAQGLRVRDAITILRNAISDPQLSLEVQYLWAVTNNLLIMLEDDQGVMRSYFGSVGTRLLELNPFDGKQMPPAISRELPPAVSGGAAPPNPAAQPLSPQAPIPPPAS